VGVGEDGRRRRSKDRNFRSVQQPLTIRTADR
jgi:hypothetical protein